MNNRIFTFARALVLASAAALVVLAAPRPAAAYTYSRTCWPSGTTLKWTSNSATMRFSSVSFPVGSYRDALQTAVNRWNENPSAFNFSTVYNDTSIDFNNGQSEVWFSSDADYDPAMEFTEYAGMFLCGNPRVSESDVVFYVGEDYTTSMDARDHWEHGDAANPSNATYRPFQTTAMHELGHSLGLGHENDEHNIMGTDWEHIHVNGDTARAYAGEDACDGAVDLYGASGTVEDLSVTTWEYQGTDGDYSEHRHVRFKDTSGNILQSNSYGEWVQYRVSPGDTIEVAFTVENNGRNNQTTDVGIYLSTNNNYVSTSDTRLGGFGVGVNRNDTFTRTTNVTIPVDLAPGEYFIGAVIDENDTLNNEVTESNNATWVAIEVQ